jgi:ferredoxin-NADP reductase
MRLVQIYCIILSHEALLIGAGIGVTPFASILKHIWYLYKTLHNSTCKRVFFVWVCREKESFEWFGQLLHTLEEDCMHDAMVDENDDQGQDLGDLKLGNTSVHDRHSQLQPTKSHKLKHSKSTSSTTLQYPVFLTLQIYITQPLTINQVRCGH